MFSRLEAADCNLDLMWRLDQDRGARNSGRPRRRVLKGKGRRGGFILGHLEQMGIRDYRQKDRDRAERQGPTGGEHRWEQKDRGTVQRRSMGSK